ncbi:hypothetical protein WNY37_08215 [Henriciella sp. AS95]|uniref:hypothetical protein n=1 Tax=Henriciella sp. AS95 TaxID=3135782 RepID=UPI00317F5EC6
MIRFLSLLLILAGIGFVAWGGLRYYKGETGASPEISEASTSAPAEMARERTPGAPVEAFVADDEDTFSTASTRSSMMSRLRTVPIAHETPSSARYNRSFEVTVAIDATGDSTAVDALPGEGNIVEGEAQVLEKAQAILSGPAFDIQAISPSIQTVSPVTENVWRWKVTPLETGVQTLRIELFALENNEALPIRTFSDSVEVKVSRLGQVIAAADQFDPLFMVLGGVGSLLAGLFGVARFFRGK